MSVFETGRPSSERAEYKVAVALTRAFLAGDIGAAELRARGARTLGRQWPWLVALVRRVLAEFGDDLRPHNHDAIAAAILAFGPFRTAFDGSGPRPEVKGHYPFHASMAQPPRALSGIALPRLDTPGDLARWLGISPAELDWFADVGGWGNKKDTEALRHYRYRWLPKADGSLRLLEVPKARLRAFQRMILRHVLERIPPHPACHGCVPGRSALSNASAHAGRSMLLRLDLSAFFPSVSGARVRALFRTVGYPDQTARYLTGLTTHCVSRTFARTAPIGEGTPPEQLGMRRQRAIQLTARHLPQGAPTSPALANLCAYYLDLRLAGSARTVGASYTRYVDDMFFSADVDAPALAARLARMACGIIMEEGFVPNLRKTRVMSRARAQHVTGFVVNVHPNVPRGEYDRIKATLTNCVRLGPASQNRSGHPDFRAHLMGHVARVAQVNPGRGLKLRALFEAIRWD